MKKILLTAAALALSVGAFSQVRIQGIEIPSSMLYDDVDMPDPDTPIEIEDGWKNISFDDIKAWYGHGPNRAALLIQFNNEGETHSRLFGYRFEEDMIPGDAWIDIAQQDPRLIICYERSSGYGGTIQGFGWDEAADGFSITDGNREITAVGGVIPVSGYGGDGWTAVEDNDIWMGGWMTDGYWSYWWAKDLNTKPGYSGYGAFYDKTLKDGMIDAWVFCPNFGRKPLKPWVAVEEWLPEGWTTTDICVDGSYYHLTNGQKGYLELIAPKADAMNATAGVTSYSGAVVVPESVEFLGKTYTVTSIADDAFRNSAVTSVSLPAFVSAPVAEMFAGCSQLT